MISRSATPFWHSLIPLAGLLFAGLAGCAASGDRSAPSRPSGTSAPVATAAPASSALPPATTQPFAPHPIMLGIDVLAADGFSLLQGKRVGLLTNPAGVNRRGVSTVDVLRQAPQVNLVALFGPEHGIYGDEKANVPVDDKIDPRTGLPVYSLYGKFRTPTAKMLANIDVMVVDLQDIGTRSYTYVSCMKYAMRACFKAGKEFVVLDRPNPLGGLKVDGPPLDADWMSYVGEFRVPYVHGLTIGELARMCKMAPGVLGVDEDVRAAGKLTVVPMRGWNRAMRWPETGLKWVPTSPMIPDFAAVVGYPMVGLGTYLGDFSHGIGAQYPFRGISHRGTRLDKLEFHLKSLNVPGVTVRRVHATDANGQPTVGLYLSVSDWEAWNPTEMNFHLMKLACMLEPTNPFADAAQAKTTRGFIIHTGSEAFFNALVRDGARIDLDPWLNTWRQQAAIYRQQSQRYWLYR
jgi:uncharacterized protein YbbC (DUF1343 family)